MNAEPYKKSWLVMRVIARMIICSEVGDRLPTVQEYAERLNVSRGIVQNALLALENGGAVSLDKGRKTGTYLTGKNPEALFQMADLSFITGSMPTPLTTNFAGLATGICHAMNQSKIPFSFAFVQGAGQRVAALQRKIYDFVVVSQAAALQHVTASPELEIVKTLDGCQYANPYVLCTHSPEIDRVKDGMRIAADRSTTDQYRITQQICLGKNVQIIDCSYTTSRVKFLEGEADCLVFHKDEWIDLDATREDVFVHELPIQISDDYMRPCVLAHRENPAISQILRKFLDSELIAEQQRDVVSGKKCPQFF